MNINTTIKITKSIVANKLTNGINQIMKVLNLREERKRGKRDWANKDSKKIASDFTLSIKYKWCKTLLFKGRDYWLTESERANYILPMRNAF